QRLQSGKFALIPTVWDKFIRNSQSCYKPHCKYYKLTNNSFHLKPHADLFDICRINLTNLSLT
ncbi:unnamed protein product, partial [Heterotrigona itama]